MIQKTRTYSHMAPEVWAGNSKENPLARDIYDNNGTMEKLNLVKEILRKGSPILAENPF